MEFARDGVLVYLEDDDAVTRREAAVCCCHLVEHSSRVVELAATSSHVVNTRSGRTTGVGARRRRHLIEEVGARRDNEGYIVLDNMSAVFHSFTFWLEVMDFITEASYII